MTPTPTAATKIRFAVDRGGTFTDVHATWDDGRYETVEKLLSEDPGSYPDAPREGLRRVLERVTGVPHPASAPLPSVHIESIRMGTTVATNALLERKGALVGLLTNAGLGDALEIAHQARPDIFCLEIKKLASLHHLAVEASCRLRVVPAGKEDPANPRHVRGKDGDWVEVLVPVDEAEVSRALRTLRDAGCTSLAVVLMHSYAYDGHERQVGDLAAGMFEHIALSSQLVAMPRIVPRGLTTCVDAYLTPKIKEYLTSFLSGFQDPEDVMGKSLFMQSDGGLVPARSFRGFKAVMSGPAGGVVGYAHTSYDAVTAQPVIGFDMGGTSTDISRFAGHFGHVYDTEVSGVMIQAPQLDITTVAAGGGSRLFFRDGMFVCGPESAGSNPGPVCYRRPGGLLAITDANLFLGRLPSQFFPKIFGVKQDEPLDEAGVAAAFRAITQEVNAFYTQRGLRALTEEEVAYGFVCVANEAMCRPIRQVTMARGFDTSSHALACFGGAGGQHACAIARSLGMARVIVNRHAGILSAVGLGLADVVAERQCPVLRPEDQALSDVGGLSPALSAALARLEAEARAELAGHGICAPEREVRVERFLLIRFQGTDVATIVREPAQGEAHYGAAFLAQYQAEFGFTLPGRALLVDVARVRAVGVTRPHTSPPLAQAASLPEPVSVASCYFEGGRLPTPVYSWGQLGAGVPLPGPAIVISGTSTVLVEPGCTASMTASGNLVLDVPRSSSGGEAGAGGRKVTTELDVVQLSVFSHRFMSIAEQMGRTLQRTAVSVNIKERLDFSCALFSADGGLVASAPHIPVHLGSCSAAVRWQMKLQGADIRPGDVLVTNHPAFGGSHLPDITVISPCFSAETGRIVFWVASRGHHADIGGITPGSMPPFSTTLDDEGACIKSFKLVRDGVFQEEGVTALLRDFPAGISRGPGQAPVSGTRNLRDNLNDLKAQVAANERGIQLIHGLIAEYGEPVVLAYMDHIQLAAELAVREMLARTTLQRGLPEVSTVVVEDAMDDGTPVRVSVTVDRTRPGGAAAVVDFTGSGVEVWGNWNAPEAVTLSAVIFCMRCLVSRDIPLNWGCLKPVEVIIPEGSFLSPSPTAAVVGGNVLTSQRITDILLEAFGACANSQGCMNNFTFGTSSAGYYETIGGGAGAGPTWHGASAVQVLMTNTRITDAEVLERRFPVLVRRFAIRRGSGGAGEHRGGDGIIREIEFLEPMVASVLSERRSLAPRGLMGGGEGKRGVNLLISKDGKVKNLGGKNSVQLAAHDRIRIETPGGGGFGEKK